MDRLDAEVGQIGFDQKNESYKASEIQSTIAERKATLLRSK